MYPKSEPAVFSILALWSVSLLTFGIDIPKKVAKNDTLDCESNSTTYFRQNRTRSESKYIELDLLGSEKSKDRLNKLLDGRFMNPEILSVMLSLFLEGANSDLLRHHYDVTMTQLRYRYVMMMPT